MKMKMKQMKVDKISPENTLKQLNKEHYFTQ